MTLRTVRRGAATMAAVGLLGLALSACGGGGGNSTGSSGPRFAGSLGPSTKRIGAPG